MEPCDVTRRQTGSDVVGATLSLAGEAAVDLALDSAELDFSSRAQLALELRDEIRPEATVLTNGREAV